MKRFTGTLISIAAAVILMNSCSVNDPVLFEDSFVFIVDESGAYSSTVSSQSQNLLSTYYVWFVAPLQSQDVTVSYDIKVGDGLTEGADYKLVSSASGTLTFAPGIYRQPLRIEWLRNELDSSKDNTLVIELTGCSLSGTSIGRPGPAGYGSSYSAVKK